MERPEILEARRRAFLGALAQTGVITQAAKIAGVSRKATQDWRKEPEFAQAFAQAMEEAADRIEREAIRRAVEGVDEPVIHKGEPTLLYELDERGNVVMEVVDGTPRPKLLLDENGRPRMLTTKVYSDRLLELLLRGFKPARYAQQSKVELSMRPDMAEAILAARRRAAAEEG